jgi:hypothetical protein
MKTLNNNIVVKIKEVYGVKRVYIVSEHAPLIKALTGRETLTDFDIETLKALGFSFEVEAQKI